MKTMTINLRHIYLCVLMLMFVNVVWAQDYQTKHEVQRGETLASIAKQYGVTELMIKEANPQMGNLFYVGLKLNIPSKGKVSDKIVDKEHKIYSESESMVSNNNNSSLIHHHTSSGMVDYDAEGVDNYFVYQPDFKTYGLDVSMDMYKYFFWGMSFYSNLKFKPSDLLSGQVNINLGIKKRIVFDDRFMASFKINPYIGWMLVPSSDDTEFTYGAAGAVNIGLKIFDTSNGKSVFLTGGYNIMAGEFRTEGMFDYGAWMLGITFISK